MTPDVPPSTTAAMAPIGMDVQPIGFYQGGGKAESTHTLSEKRHHYCA